MNVLGLKITSHDTGAALIADGRIIAIAEERLNRIKHSFNMFPRLSIDYCLNALGVSAEEIDLVVMDQVGLRARTPMKEIFQVKTNGRFSGAAVEVINHHDAHAASAFFCSPFAESAILVYDGAGEKFETHLGVLATETETLYRGVDTRIRSFQKTLHLRDGKRFPYTFGIGKLYSFLSQFYLALGPYNEGKMMGLASYGTDSILRQFPQERWWHEAGGAIVCNARISPAKRPALERIASSPTLAVLLQKIRLKLSLGVKAAIKRLLSSLNKKYFKEIYADPRFFDQIILPRPARDPRKDLLPDQYYSSVAYAGQKILERVAVEWGKKVKDVTGSKNLCVAGGVGLNIDANKNFLDVVGFEDIFIQPGSSDTGIALGSALYGWHVLHNHPRFFVMRNASLGRSYHEAEILKALERCKDRVEYSKRPAIAQESATLLKQGAIIGWFQGGAEYGPRSLGNRSILCDARRPEIKDILNERVKHREPWRPFAASVLEEDAAKYFELERESPFMLLAAPVRPEERGKIPAVTHIDGTSRIQTVTKENNGIFYDLISEFKKLTGTGLILNTSFNLGGDPIIETPEDALNCFLKTEMDYLILEDYLVGKK